MNVQKRLTQFLGKTPDVSNALFVAANATVVGDVRLAPGSSVFYGAVLRADINSIIIGPRSNVQDNVVVHLSDDAGVVVGADCTIGHGAILHACTLEDGCLIGMGATVIDGARIGARSLVGANSLVPHNFKCPPGSLVFGSPAKVIRALSGEEQQDLVKMAAKYVEVAKAHAALASGRAR